ncbi:hypothetical protein Mal4_05310 [Maioricimonas rarisocia]|uniref:Uncharacterized protein n=1 Tax=Maioricimonas rarisocia TaxID=2528026 RepID=A0A517Z187_9PLAN|nr:class I SAM-dependent methyltransferase [Maioricimonas rarisocia]QDU36247.1 hypothetical protein Mal4_05310 [Maioricimonas rarisocia]
MATIHDTQVAPQDVEAFGNRLLEMMTGASLAMMISIGHRTGLFDVLAGESPLTSYQTADKAGLNERYVREWLGAMVTGRVIDYDSETQTYQLPDAHAALLTRAATPENMAATMQWFAVLGQVEDRIVDCFHNGGGVHYSHYSRFHEVMAEESAQTVVAALHDHILPLVPDLGDRLQEGIDVMDVGCGAGRALNLLAETFPSSRFVGVDFSEEAIEMGRQLARDRGLTNTEFIVRDAAQLGETVRFDLITAFDAIHDQIDPAAVLAGIRQALRRDGVFLMQDIAASSHLHENLESPIAPLLYTISCMHCMSVSLANDGAGLGTCWGEELAQEMLRDAGFGEIALHHLDHDIMNTYYVARQG